MNSVCIRYERFEVWICRVKCLVSVVFSITRSLSIMELMLSRFLSFDFLRWRFKWFFTEWSGCMNLLCLGHGVSVFLLYITLSNVCLFFNFKSGSCWWMSVGHTFNVCLSRMYTERPWYSCLNMESIAKIYSMHVGMKNNLVNIHVCNVAKSTVVGTWMYNINHIVELLCEVFFRWYKRTMTEQGQ